MKSPLIKPLSLGLSAMCLFGGCSVVGDLVSSAISPKKKSNNHNLKLLGKHSTQQQAKQEQLPKTQHPQKPSVSPKSEMQKAIESYNKIAKSHAFEKLAANGNAEAYRYLGLMTILDAGGFSGSCFDTEGTLILRENDPNPDRTNADYKQALEYFKTAAEKGSVEALDNIGQMVAAGCGTPKNSAKALEYFKKGADKGSARAAFDAGILYRVGVGVAKDEKKTLEYTQKAANKGLRLALRFMGNFYGTGKGVAKDLAKAREYFQKASDRGDIEGSYRLGVMYKKGEGGPKDLAKAIEYFKKAKGYEDTDAQLVDTYAQLGDMYLNGQGVSKDYGIALKYLQKAADNKSKSALTYYDLSLMYSNGWGVSVDKDKATAYMQEACYKGYEKACTILSK